MQPHYDVTAAVPYYFPETTGHCAAFNSLMPFLAESGLRSAVITSDRLYSFRSATTLQRRARYGETDVYRFPSFAAGRRSLRGQFRHAFSLSVRTVARVLRFPTRSVLCITTPPFLFVFLAAVCRARRIPLFLWAMDLYPEVLVATGLLKPGTGLHRLFARMARGGYRRASHIFTLGPVMSRRLLSQGVEPEKMTEVHMWVPGSVAYVPREENPFVREHRLEDSFVVQYSGNMGVVHSFDLLLGAARRMARLDPTIRFVLIGDGPKRAELDAAVARERLENVMIMDYVPLERLSHSLSAADLSFVSLGGGLEGVIAPSKIYGALKVGTPFVLVQERESDLSRILAGDVEGIAIGPDDLASFEAYIRSLRGDQDRLVRGRRKNALWYRRNCSLETNAVKFLNKIRELLPGEQA